MRGRPIRVAVFADFREEAWPSMDLVAEMLVAQASRLSDVEAVQVRPRMIRLASRVRAPASWGKHLRNADRALGRYVQYPLEVAALGRGFDAYHVTDHSYAHLAHILPPDRTGIYCHDVDAFRPLWAESGRAGPARQALARLLRSGLRRASVVFYSTEAVRREIESHRLVEPTKLVRAPYGIADEFSPDGVEHARSGRVLHVGSLIPRKNPLFLIRLFARLASRFPELTLLQVGGTWAAEHLDEMRALRIEQRVEQVRGISRADLASHYRGAALVLVPSLAEGFGLPVIEALACGAPVLASDIPVLRESGGDAAAYGPVGDLDAWESLAIGVLTTRGGAPERQVRLAQAARFSWRAHAHTILNQYRSISAWPPGSGPLPTTSSDDRR